MPSTRAQSGLDSAFDRLEQVDSLKLVPNEVNPGSFWWPDHYAPSSVLTRTATQPQDPAAELVLTRLIGTNGFPERQYSPEALSCDIYYASVKDGDDVIPGLVAKFFDSESRLASAAFVEEFEMEAQFFTTAKDVQGSALPRFAGLFTSGSLNCLVFEDAGRRLTDEDYGSKRVKDDAVQALKSIQATGLNPYVRHDTLRLGHDGRVKFRTLWHAQTVQSPEEMEALRRDLPDLGDMTAEELWQQECRGTLRRLQKMFSC